MREREKQTSSLCHFYGLYSLRPPLFTNQCKKSLCYCKKYISIHQAYVLTCGPTAPAGPGGPSAPVEPYEK